MASVLDRPKTKDVGQHGPRFLAKHPTCVKPFEGTLDGDVENEESNPLNPKVKLHAGAPIKRVSGIGQGSKSGGAWRNVVSSILLIFGG